MTPLLLAALLAGSAPEPLRDLLARRDYPQAVAYYAGRPGAAAARNLARVYDHWHKYDSSVVWWERARALEPDNDSAIAGRWFALIHRDEKDSARLPLTESLVAREAARYLMKDVLCPTPSATLRERTLAYDGLSVSDTTQARPAAMSLTHSHPDSPRAYELIGAMFYDSLYPVWTNDTAKVPIIRRFLTRYPVSEWRQTFYMFLMSSLFGLKDTARLRATAAEAVGDDTLDPFRPRYAAALFNRLKFAPAQAEAYARRAIALEPGATRPPNKPQEQWELDYPPLRGQALLALAEALGLQGKHEEAKLHLGTAIREFRWDNDSEWTPGPFYALLGEMQEVQADTGRALLSYARALRAGDSRNYWTTRADSGFRRLQPGAGQQQVETGRSLLGYSGACFTDVTEAAGLAERRESRVAWGDYDNDGYDDLLLSGCVLFRNDSGRRFVNVTDSAGLTGASGRGGVWADYDNDGWLDFWMSAGSGLDRLWHNDKGRFHDATVEAGTPADSLPTEGAAWADFDNDGWVDLYCANYENWELHSYFPDRLWRNVGGRFIDWTDSGAVRPPYGTDLAGRGVNWGDYDDDGLQDCFVSNYRLCENFLWHNNGDRTFENLAGQMGVSGDEVSGWYGHTIGSEWADCDNDGDLDLFTADLAHPRYIEFSNRSRLYENLGPGRTPRFVDRRAVSGIRFEETHSDPAWADVDNDGDLDLYVTSIYEGRRSFLYLNSRRPRPTDPTSFEEATWLSGT
ncbi:VCBS repeat-containing protein, partial [candidate division WOR-3 bacterium]|nr:VCBS repeat-containing protein [candidate division WOR-3 bacterium]